MEIIVDELNNDKDVKIKAIGVGGGGNNTISYLKSTLDINGNVSLVSANTDAQHLKNAQADHKLQLGTKLTKGQGAGMKPEVGKEAAIESYDEIKQALLGSDIVFIAAGLGGGTGTGAAPVIAQIAKEIGALTISVVTKPFKWEGKKRAKFAETGLKDLREESDSILVIPNDKILSIVDKNFGLKESYKMIDDVLAKAVKGISEIILECGLINVDFEDVATVMSNKGLAIMGMASSVGTSSAQDALQSAIELPLFDNVSIKGAMGVLVNFRCHSDYPIHSISEAMSILHDTVDEEANVVHGVLTDDTIEPDSINVTIIATGFEKGIFDDNKPQDNKSNEATPATIKTLSSLQKVGNSDVLFDMRDSDLDIPSYKRKQQD